MEDVGCMEFGMEDTGKHGFRCWCVKDGTENNGIFVVSDMDVCMHDGGLEVVMKGIRRE